MSAQFHTPSFGDEIFDLTDVEPIQTIEITNITRSCGSQTNFNDEVKRQKTDFKEPAKPVSAYALFFHDTVSAIKAQNPNTSFEDISKIVHSMWQVLDPNHKNVYNKKSELAKREYIKQMASRNIRSISISQDETLTQTQDQISFVQHPNVSPKPSQIASKPAVFTISRVGPETSSPAENKQTIGTANNVLYCNSVTQTSQEHNTVNQQPQNMQTPNESDPIEICIRENCNKRATVNPDWEDEYCSNECVVIHCRNVFNEWVKSKLEDQS